MSKNIKNGKALGLISGRTPMGLNCIISFIIIVVFIRKDYSYNSDF